jgi:hypothetical protein
VANALPDGDPESEFKREFEFDTEIDTEIDGEFEDNLVGAGPVSLARQELRATQSLVSFMGFAWGNPSLVLLEIAWRWLFGIPFLFVCWSQAQLILAQIPPSSVGLDRLEFQNPWLSSELLAEGIARYEPAIGEVLKWLLPVGMVAWAIVSGLGRTLVLARMNSIAHFTDRPIGFYLRKAGAYMVLQALWMLALLTCLWIWFRSVGWASATHITVGAQPDLVGYLCWLIFLSLAVYVVWALASWTLAMAPLILFLEDEVKTPWAALRRSFSLGKTLSSKLMEVSLVLAIVKIMLIVLDMVFSAAPLPFADEFGPGALHVLYVVVFIVFLIANDYFYVVRLRSFIELWRLHRTVSKS